MSSGANCFRCGSAADVSDMYGYSVCQECRPQMILFTDETIQRHRQDFKPTQDVKSYREELQRRLEVVGREYIEKTIKLKYIIDRLKEIN